VLEKVPLFLLAAASSVITFMVQHGGGAVLPVSRVSLGMRAANAVVSYGEYLRKTFWPSDLAVFYPRLTEIPWWHVTAAGAALAAVTALAVWQVQRRPYLAVGWFWYLGTLVPVVGLVQVGEQALADRYTYIPLIGIFLSIVWGAAELLRGVRWGRAVAVGAGATAIAACLVAATVQVRYWQNNFLLYQHAIEVVPDNYLAHGNLGMALAEDGQLEAAVAEFDRAVEINPGFAAAHNSLGALLAALGRPGGALFHLREAVRLDPESAMGRSNLGIALMHMGLTDEAAKEFREALRLDPEHTSALVNLGLILANRGQTAEAIVHLRAAVRLAPDLAEAHNGLGRILDRAGKVEESAAEYREAIRLRPDYGFAYHNLGVAMAKLGRPEEAVQLAEQACRLTARREPACLAALASAYADAGRFAEAVAAAEEAGALAAALGRRDLAGLIDGRLPFYRAGRPHRETPGPQSRNVK
jgi:tetratricopeptide (TPR) repeat protein